MAVEMQDWSREELEREAERRGIGDAARMSRNALIDALRSGEVKGALGAARALFSRVVDRVKGAIPRPRKEDGGAPQSVRPPTASTPPREVPRHDLAEGDSVDAAVIGPDRVRVRWRIAASNVERARFLIERGTLCARAVVVSANERHMVSSRVHDHEPIEERGEWVVAALPPGARVTVAIGLKLGESFVSIAHTAVVRVPVRSDHASPA